VLGCAGLGLLRIDLIVAARLLGVASTLAIFCAITALARDARRSEDDDGRAPFEAFVACALLAACGTIAVWSIGGLEQPLVAALLAWAVVHASRLADRGETRARSGVGLGVVLGLLCLTRPDSPLFVVALVFALVSARRATWRAALTAGAVAAAFTLAQLGFRLAYYGDWVPNTAYVKLVLSTQRVRAGLEYLTGGALETWFVMGAGLAALCIAIAHKESRGRGLLLLCPAVAWASYVVFIGGDIFPAHRHLFVLHTLAALASLELWRWLGARVRRPAVLALGFAVVLASFALHQLSAPANVMARNERWEWDGAVIGRLMRAAFALDAPLMAVTASGCLPYFSRLPAVDMLGLNDRHIARRRPADFGHGYLGHELGDGSYVLDREPDLVFFFGALGAEEPHYRSGKEMVQDPRFAAQYEYLCFEGVVPYVMRAGIWVRTASGKLAPRRAADGRSIVLPGHLFAGRDEPVAALDDQRRIGVRLAPGQMGDFVLRDVPAGAWTFDVESSGAPVELDVRDLGAPAEGDPAATDSAAGAAFEELELVAPSSLVVRVRAGALPAHVRAVHAARR
jgi:energy-converting hydrogenase Eha subunit B